MLAGVGAAVTEIIENKTKAIIQWLRSQARYIEEDPNRFIMHPSKLLENIAADEMEKMMEEIRILRETNERLVLEAITPLGDEFLEKAFSTLGEEIKSTYEANKEDSSDG